MPRERAIRIGATHAVAIIAGCLAFFPAACGPTVPTVPASPVVGTPSGDISPTPASTASPAPTAAVDPAAARLVWLADRSGELGVWTTDLAGGDARTYAAGLDEGATAIRDATLAGEDIVLIRDGPTSDLWLVPAAGTSVILLDRVEAYRVIGPDEVLALRAPGKTWELWRVPLAGRPPERIGDLVPAAVGGGELGPFGLAVSPDGRTIAAGWVGGPVTILGPVPGESVDVGAPLVVDDAGQLVAVTGRAGEAYTVEGGTVESLAPPDADPVAVPRSGLVAWGVTDSDGRLEAVDVHDVLRGTHRSYPAAGGATNVSRVTGEHVLLEATAFDPLHRTVAYLDLASGAFGVFEVDAPEGGPR